ncbi:helix-turn-helix transcriptional regulator [Bacillus sp. FJAT-49736]|uniref:helix-turn-helix transcriptional regulator n=1 Tax=Bacillus sp. FJAT-49736 TaxID=2833582 RepID=UPI001BC9D08E|nr:helix-turn-helix transcriptional regulator [Bacillus sp. FJAT-49736]MBS4173516.1 helix-turn-helix transcriptional regulator [Bacillus sp. FJAT-49736]
MVNRIKDYRTRNGISPKELAKLVDISVSHLRKIERGEGTPSLKLAVRIAKALGCTLDDLFF